MDNEPIETAKKAKGARAKKAAAPSNDVKGGDAVAKLVTSLEVAIAGGAQARIDTRALPKGSDAARSAELLNALLDRNAKIIESERHRQDALIHGIDRTIVSLLDLLQEG